MSTEVRSVIARDIDPMVAANGAGGVAVAVRMNGRTLFFNYGYADQVEKRPITSDALFNVGSVRKVFEATLVAKGVQRGELSLDDPVNKYVTELQGDYIRRVTIGQLATHTSGLSLPTDHPPWPTQHYSLTGFYDALNAFTPQNGEAPGKQHIYSHAGYILLQLALERRYGKPIAELIEDGVTNAARHEIDDRARARRRRPRHDEPGFPGAHGARLFVRRRTDRASRQSAGLFRFFRHRPDVLDRARSVDPARGLPRRRRRQSATVGRAANDAARSVSHRPASRTGDGLGNHHPATMGTDGPTIVDKPGGLNNASAYIGLVPERKIGIVILANRGDVHPFEAARSTILPALSRMWVSRL